MDWQLLFYAALVVLFYALALLAAFNHLSKNGIRSFRISDAFSSVLNSNEDHTLQNNDVSSDRSVGVRRLLQALFQNVICCSSQSKVAATLEALHIVLSD